MEFLSVFNSIGTPALILLVLVILFFMIKEIKQENSRLTTKFDESQEMLNEKISAFKDEMKRSMAEQQARQDKRDAKQDEASEQLALRLRDVESNYAKKIDVQEAVGGWRTELKTLGDRIDMYFIGGKNGRS